MSAYFAPLVNIPTVIDKPGTYRTRDGETVTIERISRVHDFGCIGHYANGTGETWHKSGRLFASRTSVNDITEKA